MDRAVELEILFRDERVEDLKSVLTDSGAAGIQSRSERGWAELEWVLGCTIALSTLANLVIRLLPLWKCGVIVDARGAKISVQKSCDVPAGSVLAFTQGGEMRFYKPTTLEINSLLKEAEHVM
jgi:hypothetical protein